MKEKTIESLKKIYKGEFNEILISFLNNNLPIKYKEDEKFILNLCKEFNDFNFLNYASKNLLDSAEFLSKYIDTIETLLNENKENYIKGAFKNRFSPMKKENISLDIFSERLRKELNYQIYSERGIEEAYILNLNVLEKIIETDKNRNNKEYQIEKIKEDFNNLKNVSINLSNDLELALIAIKQSPDALNYIGDEIKKDFLFAKYCIKKYKDGNLLRFFACNVREDKEVCDIAFNFNEDSMRYFRNIKTNFPNLYEEYKNKGWYPYN